MGFEARAWVRWVGGGLLCAALAAGRMAAGQADAAPAKDPQDVLTSLLYKTRAGLTLNYVEQGDAAGPTLVLLHGAGDSWHSWDRVFPLIPPRYHVFALTLRGHGLSDHPATGFGAEDYAGDVLDFLAGKDLRHVTLVGHSMGSFAAQRVAELDAAGRLDGLVLVGSGPGSTKARAAGEPALQSVFSRLEDPIPYTFARDFQASTIYSPVPARNFEIWVSEAQRVPAATWHGIGSAQRVPSEELRRIKVPVLVLWGEKDSIFSRADQDKLIGYLGKGRLVAYPETGHALHWERPERFTRDLLSFVNEVRH